MYRDSTTPLGPRPAQVTGAALPRWFALAAALLGLLVPAANAASAQAAAPAWKLTVTANADYFIPDAPAAPEENAYYTIEAENVGDAPTSDAEPILLEDVPPAGLAAEEVGLFASGHPATPRLGMREPNFAASGLCPQPERCEFPGPLGSAAEPIAPGQKLVMLLRVDVPEGTSGSLVDLAKVRGGGAARVTAVAVNEADAAPSLGFHSFSTDLTDSAGAPYTQAGGHPYEFVTEFNPLTMTLPHAPGTGPGRIGISPVGDPREISAELPPGLIGNPQGLPVCELARYFAKECTLGDVVGTAAVRLAGKFQQGVSAISPLFNLQPTGEAPGELGYEVAGISFILSARLRSGSDYGLTILNTGTPQNSINRVRVTTWGVPADPSHDEARGKSCEVFPDDAPFVQSVEGDEAFCAGEFGLAGFLHGGPAGVPPAAFLTMPTQCTGASMTTRMSYDSWQEPGHLVSATDETPPVDACNQLAGLFEPEIEARPTTNRPDQSAGLEFNLSVPQHESCTEPPSVSCEPATPSLKEAVVRLPAGLSVNPSSANGLGACSPGQVGLATPVGQTPAHFTEVPADCPAASLIGTAEVNTPLLHNPLMGGVYLATPHQNPFGSLLAAYIVLEGEGLIIKLPGQIEADPATGQLTGKFLENPQTPFEDFHLNFFGGARGDLRTPAVCGSYTTTSTLTPYSAPESGPAPEPGSSFQLDNGGAACPHQASEQANAPAFRAGTESPQAGKYTPFSFRLARQDGSQEFSKIETTLPPGLVGKLAGVGQCSEAQLGIAASREHEGGGAAELASPSCPASSEVGTVQVASGAGPTPLYVTGHAYLAGPYKGAPISLAIITPAVAGPFDLGDVLVRSALYVDPITAQIKAVSDPLPKIIEGIPLDVRSVTLKMSRPNFTLNPTDCEEMGFAGTETSLLGNVAPLSQRFQVGGCKSLGFEPQLSLRLKGGTRRAQSPALVAKLTMPSPGVHSVPCRKHGKKSHCKVRVPQQANVAGAQVTLPHSAFLQQSHIQKTCGRPELAAHTCPAASIYGHAKAVTPLLDHPLEGPVYLATGFGYNLPALVADLNGQIEVLLKGKVDTGREDGLRNTFEVVPDAPVSSFTLSMFGGKKGLIVNSENLCGRHAKRKALARFTAQNGKTVELEPTVANSCGKHKGKKKGAGKKGHKHSRPAGRSSIDLRLPW